MMTYIMTMNMQTLENRLSSLEKSVDLIEKTIAGRLKAEIAEYTALEKDYSQLESKCANLNKASVEAEENIDFALNKIQEALDATA